MNPDRCGSGPNYAKLRLSLVLRAIIVDLIIERASGPLSFFAFGIKVLYYLSSDLTDRMTKRVVG